jgi:uncharacterized protein YndB with AHSA1/START domain
MAENDFSKRVLTLKKTLDAPVALVWEAWTEPGHIAQWWGPKGMAVKVVEHDFKVGGKWKYVMPMPNGSEFISEGEYSEIVKFQKIITSANFKPMTEGVELRALFEKIGDKTNFTFSVVHPTEEYCKQQEQMGFYNGWGSTFERLNAYLTSIGVSRTK